MFLLNSSLNLHDTNASPTSGESDKVEVHVLSAAALNPTTGIEELVRLISDPVDGDK